MEKKHLNTQQTKNLVTHTFEKIRHLANVAEAGALAPLVHDVHHERLELGDVVVDVDLDFRVSRILGDASSHVLHRSQRPAQFLDNNRPRS